MKLIKQTGQNIEKLYNRHLTMRKKMVEEKVRGIINDVRLNGDDALLKYTRRFDGVKLTARQLRVAESEISIAFQKDRKSTRLNSSHSDRSRMPSSA